MAVQIGQSEEGSGAYYGKINVPHNAFSHLIWDPKGWATSGTRAIAIGKSAFDGYYGYGEGNHNIYLGSRDGRGESHCIRIGDPETQIMYSAPLVFPNRYSPCECQCPYHDSDYRKWLCDYLSYPEFGLPHKKTKELYREASPIAMGAFDHYQEIHTDAYSLVRVGKRVTLHCISLSNNSFNIPEFKPKKSISFMVFNNQKIQQGTVQPTDHGFLIIVSSDVDPFVVSWLV